MKKFWKSVASPPYPMLPWLVLAYVIACLFLTPHRGGVFTGRLIGYDDQVRMTQVLNWVNGAGWYDRTIMRADPPEGFTTIWSRIVDIPIAAVVVLAQQFVPQKTAALIAATVIPLFETALLFIAAPYFARPLVGKNKANLIILFLIFTSILNAKNFSLSGFFVGEASHHPWYVILNLVMFGAMARLIIGSLRNSPVLMLGGSVALLTSVGIESHPMIAGMTIFLAIAAWGANRPNLASRGSMGLLIGAAGSLLLLPMHQPLQNLFTISFAEPSILGCLFVFSAGIFLKIEYEILKRMGNRWISATTLLFVGIVIALALAYAFPALLKGAGAGLSPAEHAMAVVEHLEARSIWAVSGDTLDFIGLAMPIVIALITGFVAAYRAQGRRRWVYICYFGFAGLGGGMSAIFSRYYHHAMTTACAWLLWLWERIKFHFKKNLFYKLIVVTSFIAIGPFWLFLLPAFERTAPFVTEVLLFPADLQSVEQPCDSLSIADYINEHYDKKTLISVPAENSAHFLYETNIRLDFLSNYPSHDKFIDNYKLFRTPDPAVARDIVLLHGIDLIAVCDIPKTYDPNYPDAMQSFYTLLQVAHAPNWLKLINPEVPTHFLLYKVDKEALEAKKR